MFCAALWEGKDTLCAENYHGKSGQDQRHLGPLSDQYWVREFFQGRNVSRALGWRWPPPPQAASSPPQGPNTLHIYIGAPANTVHLLQKVFSLNKTLISPKYCPQQIRDGNIPSFSPSSSHPLVMRAVLPESHYWQKGKRKIPQLEQLAEHFPCLLLQYPCLLLHTGVDILAADNS